jgi:Na+/citrate or Na+/malate symporter
MEKNDGFKLFNMPWSMFCFITVIVLIATYFGVLPPGMTGCFIFMIVIGTFLDLIGNKTPIIRSFFGGGASLIGERGAVKGIDDFELLCFLVVV